MFCDENWDPGVAHDVIAHHVTAFLLAEIAGDGEAHAALSPSRHLPSSRVGYRAVGY